MKMPLNILYLYYLYSLQFIGIKLIKTTKQNNMPRQMSLFSIPLFILERTNIAALKILKTKKMIAIEISFV